MNIFETKISCFKSTYKTEVDSYCTIEDVLNSIKCGQYRDEITKLRNGDATIKQHLPTYSMHGLFRDERKAKNFMEASGLIVLDIDDVNEEDLEEYKDSIMEESEHVLASMISPSGNGIKVLYYVQPDIITADNYRQIGKQIIQDFEDYGKVDFLSVTDCLISTWDKDILINSDATPAFIAVQEVVEIVGELEERDESKTLWDCPEEFYETVLFDEIISKTNNNYHFIQVSIMDLAKFGFKHPKDDLSFIVDISETQFKVSNENKKRFNEACEIANTYPQTRWAYKTIHHDDFEEEEDFTDFSEFTPKVKNESTDEESEEDENGLVDYQNLFSKVLETIAEGDRVGYEVSLVNFADVFRFRGSGILTVTGIPGHGKTEFVDALTLDMARQYGHQTIIAGFEQSHQEHIIKLMRKMIGADITCPSFDEDLIVKKAYEFVVSKIKHVDTSKFGGDITKILGICAESIHKLRAEGGDPKYIVIDPFNMLSIKSKSGGHEKIEQILRAITQFSHQMEVLVILVAHPFKMRKDEKTGEFEVPDFYSVKGSSAFFEMSYHGLVVYRKPNGSVMVKVLKVKQNNLGTTGAEVFFEYDKPSGRYIPIDEEGNELGGDHRAKDWMTKIFKNN